MPPNPEELRNLSYVLYPPPQSSEDECDSTHSSEYFPFSQERSQIVGGFVIPYWQCWSWLQRTYNVSLKPDHSEDLTATGRLEEAINEHGYDWQVEFGQHHNVRNYDLLLVTQRVYGQFMNHGPVGEEEVLQNDLRDILTSGKWPKTYLNLSARLDLLLLFYGPELYSDLY